MSGLSGIARGSHEFYTDIWNQIIEIEAVQVIEKCYNSPQSVEDTPSSAPKFSDMLKPLGKSFFTLQETCGTEEGKDMVATIENINAQFSDDVFLFKTINDQVLSLVQNRHRGSPEELYEKTMTILNQADQYANTLITAARHIDVLVKKIREKYYFPPDLED